jgi:hypothetical protein
MNDVFDFDDLFDLDESNDITENQAKLLPIRRTIVKGGLVEAVLTQIWDTVAGKTSLYRYRRVYTGINILYWHKPFYTRLNRFVPV